jgi:hypothetical protein
MLVGSIALIGVATLFMTQLNADTPVPVVWLWMFLAGLGVGPTFSVFTIVVQNAVPFSVLGVATSNLTFFRQIGGTVALAFVGTIFATSFQEDLAKQMACGCSRRRHQRLLRGGPGGQDRLQRPDRRRWHRPGDHRRGAIAAPVIDAVVQARNAAFSLAVSRPSGSASSARRSRWSRRRSCRSVRSGPATPKRPRPPGRRGSAAIDQPCQKERPASCPIRIGRRPDPLHPLLL